MSKTHKVKFVFILNLVSGNLKVIFTVLYLVFFTALFSFHRLLKKIFDPLVVKCSSMLLTANFCLPFDTWQAMCTGSELHPLFSALHLGFKKNEANQTKRGE